MNDRAQQERILRGEVQVLYIGPELLMLNTVWRDMLTTPVYKENLVAFVVDEAHCVAKWSVQYYASKMACIFKAIIFPLGVTTSGKSSNTLGQ